MILAEQVDEVVGKKIFVSLFSLTLRMTLGGKFDPAGQVWKPDLR